MAKDLELGESSMELEGDVSTNPSECVQSSTTSSFWNGKKSELIGSGCVSRNSSLLHLLERLIPDFIRKTHAQHQGYAAASKSSTINNHPQQFVLSTIPGTKEHSDAIDRQLAEASQRSKDERQALILGAVRGETKHQIMTMMKIIQQHGLSQDDIQAYKSSIIETLISEAASLARILVELGTELGLFAERHREAMEIIMRLEQRQQCDDFVAAVESLWKDPDIQAVYRRYGEHGLSNSSAYLFTAARRICSTDYMPTEMDVLHCPQRKFGGIKGALFEKYGRRLTILDLDWIIRGERRKWIYHLEIVDMVLFLVDLEDYDRKLPKDATGNVLSDFVMLFDSVANSRWFRGRKFSLLIARAHSFKQKLRENPLEKTFPDYKSGSNPDKALDYVVDKFRAVNKSGCIVFSHVIEDTTDKVAMRVVFEEILNEALSP